MPYSISPEDRAIVVEKQRIADVSRHPHADASSTPPVFRPPP
jgi:hypothetical protein